MQIIHENEYEETMKNIVTPYLLSHRRELYVPGADYPFRNESKRITGKIHMLQYLSDIDMPKGVVVISHGFTESAVKYDEVSIDEVIAKNLQVMDMTASILARDNKMPMWVFGLNEENSIVNTLKGKFNGTKVTV
mgnify:FL=1